MKMKYIASMKKRIMKNMRESYVNQYPEYTRESVLKAFDEVNKKYGRPDAYTINHYLAPSRFDGLGMGILKIKKLKRII